MPVPGKFDYSTDNRQDKLNRENAKRQRQATSRAMKKCRCGNVISRQRQEDGIDVCPQCDESETQFCPHCGEEL